MGFLFIIGTRPEAIKLAPVIAALDRIGGKAQICTTGQHADLLPPILAEFGLAPDFAARGDGPFPVAALQGAIRRARPAALVVQGDTRSAFAGAAAARLESVPIAHVEAGLRSGSPLDPFPEELFRIGIGRLAEMHFAPSEEARSHLLGSGAPRRGIHLTGNPVYDSVPRASAPPARGACRHGAGRSGERFLLLTVHRNENAGARLAAIFAAAAQLAAGGLPVVYVRHPRVAAADMAMIAGQAGISIRPPLPRCAFLSLLARASLVLTDSGGVQEEAVQLGRPSLILRDRTERPELLAPGFSELVGAAEGAIVSRARALIGAPPPPCRDPLKDGRAGFRIAEILAARYLPVC